jgi:hypothetical protein
MTKEPCRLLAGIPLIDARVVQSKKLFEDNCVQ